MFIQSNPNLYMFPDFVGGICTQSRFMKMTTPLKTMEMIPQIRSTEVYHTLSNSILINIRHFQEKLPTCYYISAYCTKVFNWHILKKNFMCTLSSLSLNNWHSVTSTMQNGVNSQNATTYLFSTVLSTCPNTWHDTCCRLANCYFISLRVVLPHSPKCRWL
jgi:hypothetical protein